jgi:hypothetical protein
MCVGYFAFASPERSGEYVGNRQMDRLRQQRPKSVQVDATQGLNDLGYPVTTIGSFDSYFKFTSWVQMITSDLTVETLTTAFECAAGFMAPYVPTAALIDRSVAEASALQAVFKVRL